MESTLQTAETLEISFMWVLTSACGCRLRRQQLVEDLLSSAISGLQQLPLDSITGGQTCICVMHNSVRVCVCMCDAGSNINLLHLMIVVIHQWVHASGHARPLCLSSYHFALVGTVWK